MVGHIQMAKLTQDLLTCDLALAQNPIHDLAWFIWQHQHIRHSDATISRHWLAPKLPCSHSDMPLLSSDTITPTFFMKIVKPNESDNKCLSRSINYHCGVVATGIVASRSFKLAD